MEIFLPNSILQPFVKRYMIMESEHGMINTILPDTSITMALRYKGMVKDLSPVVISGIRKSSRIVEYAENTALLLVIFKEGGAAAFFDEPMNEFANLSVSLSNTDIEERLAEANNNLQRIQIVERFLFAQLKKVEVDCLILEAVQQIQQANGNIRIKDLLTQFPLSRDPFEKRFRKITGTSPKHFASIIRLRHLISHHTDASSLTELAYDAGYFDQAHFIKDFKSFTGKSPQEFFKSPFVW